MTLYPPLRLYGSLMVTMGITRYNTEKAPINSATCSFRILSMAMFISGINKNIPTYAVMYQYSPAVTGNIDFSQTVIEALPGIKTANKMVIPNEKNITCSHRAISLDHQYFDSYPT